MPVVRKLAPEEVQDIENKGKGQRKLTEEQYDRFLAEYEVGDWGEADLEADENRLTVRNRFKAAAARRGLKLDFRRTAGNTLRFRVVSSNDDGQTQRAAAGSGRAQASRVETPPPAPEAPPKRKGGRPRKNA